MERRFDMSDFEQSLKDHADQFKMTPSKRVWNGIYNNLHPGSKWPSITVAVVFIITLVTIGSLNNSARRVNELTNKKPKPAVTSSKLLNQSTAGESFANESKSGTNSSNIDEATNESRSGNKLNVKTKSTPIISSSADVAVLVGNSSQKNIFDLKTQSTFDANTLLVEPKVSTLTSVGTSDINPTDLNAVNKQKPGNSLLNTELVQSNLPAYLADEPGKVQNDLSLPVSYKLFPVLATSPLEAKLICADLIDPLPPSNSITVQNTSISANKFHKKKNDKIEWSFYLNPTISTVAFNKKTVAPSDNSSSIVVLSSQPSFKFIHNPRFGMETGAEMTLKIAKRLQFVTGLNVSYSGYTNVSNLVHPTFATLTLNDDKGGTYSKTYITHYGNGQSQDHINLVNYNIEASIPLGIKYNIWRSQKMRIDVASLLEPSIIMRDDAYLISSDGRYYLNDPLLVRRTNVDGRFGSYITFIGRKIKWHLGPDFKYQLLSTYKNIYPAKEHLIDYGIRIGISK